MKVSNAGMLLLKAMLLDLGFDDAIKAISDPGLRFSPLDFAYTLVWMTVNDVDAPYQLNEMDLSDLAVLLTVPKPPLKDDSMTSTVHSWKMNARHSWMNWLGAIKEQV